MNFESPAARLDLRKSDAILIEIQIRREEERSATNGARQGWIVVQERLGTEQPAPFRVRHFKQCAVGPQLGQVPEFDGDRFVSLGFGNRNQPLHGFQIRACRVADGGFDTSPKAQVTNPEEGEERQRENRDVKKGQARANC